MVGSSPSASELVGLDVGGTAVKAGRVDAEGRVLERRRLELDAELGPEERLARLVELARELGAADAIGVGLPGLLDREAGLVTESPNLPWLDGLPIRAGLAEGLGIAPERVRLENDANVAALGEQWCGAAAGERDALVVTLGTGIGGGLILGGELHVGSGMAGEVGHLTIDPGGRPCPCGSRGCLETLASATAAERRARERGLTDDLPALARTARAEPDGPAAELLTEVGHDLGRGLAQVLLLLDLRCFVIGGGFAAALDTLEGGARTGLREWAYGERVAAVRLLPARLGGDAGWIGAARLPTLAPPRTQGP